jgi:hypothetical protein
MLHSLRKRLEERAKREAEGESFWTPTFGPNVRARIFHALRRRVAEMGLSSIENICVAARTLILEQEGSFSLIQQSPALPAPEDFSMFLMQGPADMFPTALEALIAVLPNFDTYGPSWGDAGISFANQANEIFQQERVAWEVVEKRMVPFESKEMHQEVAVPALRLLHESRFSKADQSYRDALRELAEGHPADAITDAGTALQEVLTELGWEGNSLGKQITWAKKAGVLRPHDNPMLDAIERMFQWVSADRSEMGDAHQATSANRDDAWLAVHVVGALIVRFAADSKRGQ